MERELPTIQRSTYTVSAPGEREDLTVGIVSTRPADMMPHAFEQLPVDRASWSSGSRSSSSSKSTEGELMRRIAQVFIADTDENLALDKGLLFQGEPTFTDLTNEELFFELDMANILKVHNAVRVATLDKETTKISGRDVYLEPARIRDLNMVVLDIAIF